MWVTKLLISPVKKRIFCPKTTKFGIFGQFGPGHAGLFNALLWVGWWLWRAGCISQDTYLLYIILDELAKKKCKPEIETNPLFNRIYNLVRRLPFVHYDHVGLVANTCIHSRASLTVRITVKNGNPPGTGKIWENRFFTGKMDHHGAKCTQIGAQTCQGTSRTCQNFFTFTFKAAGVTFLKVILHLLQKVLNRR